MIAARLPLTIAFKLSGRTKAPPKLVGGHCPGLSTKPAEPTVRLRRIACRHDVAALRSRVRAPIRHTCANRHICARHRVHSGRGNVNRWLTMPADRGCRHLPPGPHREKPRTTTLNTWIGPSRIGAPCRLGRGLGCHANRPSRLCPSAVARHSTPRVTDPAEGTGLAILKGRLAKRHFGRPCQFVHHEAKVCVYIFRFVSIYFLMRDLK